MTTEEAIEEFKGRIEYWSQTHVPDGVKPYLQAIKMAVEALRQVDSIRMIIKDVTNNFDTENAEEAIIMIREVLNG